MTAPEYWPITGTEIPDDCPMPGQAMPDARRPAMIALPPEPRGGTAGIGEASVLLPGIHATRRLWHRLGSVMKHSAQRLEPT